MAGHDQPKIIESAYMARRKSGEIDPLPIRFLSGRKYEGVDPARIVQHTDGWAIDKGAFSTCTETLLYSARGLHMNPLERGVISTCPAGADDAFKKVMYEHFMETVESPMFFLGDTSVLSLYAAGRVSGIHVDIGASCTSVSVVDRGVTTRLSEFAVAGDYIDRFITSRVDIPAPAGEHTSEFSEEVKLALAREIKHNACKCSHQTLPPTTPHRNANTRSSNRRNDARATPPLASHTPVPYKLPDGTEIDVGAVSEYAAELVFIRGDGFNGLTASILEATHDDVSALPEEPFVLLSGGSAHFQGLHTRLANELHQEEKFQHAHIFPFTQWTHRSHAAYVGASIVASLSSFASLWVTPASYKECGVDRLIHAK
jgi:actin-related protein 4